MVLQPQSAQMEPMAKTGWFVSIEASEQRYVTLRLLVSDPEEQAAGRTHRNF